MLHLLVDRHVPFLEGLLEQYPEYFQAEYLSPEEFTRARTRNADILIVRTRTRCDQSLLADSHVRLITTATIGFDHIDTAYCHPMDTAPTTGVAWTSCPGCNAQGVCDYVEEALRSIYTISELRGKSIGIIGVGHVGSKVKEMAERYGMKILLSDPPLGIGISAQQVAVQADIITFHTPLDASTRHLCDAEFLAKTKPNALIINAARGGIVDEKALLLSRRDCVIDCWEGEPNLFLPLLQSPHTRLASYHIAGYTQQGKWNASQMCLDAICRYFALPALHLPPMPDAPGDAAEGWLMRITQQLKSAPEDFELLRKNYPLR